MSARRALRLGPLLTLALAASFGMSTTVLAQATKAEAKAKAKEKAKEAAKGPIDLNSATAEELQTLPGIGEAYSRRIIDGRPHKALADLAGAGVPGPTIEKLRPLVDVKPLPPPVDVNADPVDKLETLPGVGPALAREIVAARPIAGYEGLARVKGIGPAKLDALKGRLKFGGSAPAAKPEAKPKAKTKAATQPAPGGKVNINTASKEELDTLVGIGEARARAIIDARPFSSIEDIMRVKGIKQVEFGKIKDRITVK